MFAVASVIGVFLSINRRNDSDRVRYWIVAWLLVLIHFASQLEAGGLQGIAHNIADSVSISALELAGLAMLLSLSVTFTDRRANQYLAALIGVPLMVYVNCLIWDVTAHGIYLLCIVVATGGPLVLYALLLRKLNGLMVFIAFECIGSLIWLVREVMAGAAVSGLSYSLTGLFALSGLIFWRNYRRFSAGVIVSSFGLLAWAAVFPVSIFLARVHPEIAVNPVLWNIPKFFVAVGMLLTLLEEQSVKASEMALNYKSLFELNVAAVYRISLDGRLLDCNPAFLKMFGLSSKHEALTTGVQELYASPERRQQYIHDICEQGSVHNYELEQRRMDGGRFWISESASLVSGGAGPAILGTAVDITPKKEAEEALRRSEERFAAFFRKSPIVCAINRMDDGTFIDVNDAFLEVLHKTKAEVIGKTGVDLGFWNNAEQRDDFVRQLRLKKSMQNIRITFQDGKGRQREGLFFAEFADVGGLECVIGMMTDMTDYKALEDQLRQTQKLEAIGGLAAGIAHDFNNVLSIIKGFGELMSLKLHKDPRMMKHMQNLMDAVSRGAGLTQQLLAFSKKQPFQKTRFEVDVAVQRTAKLLVPLLGEDILLSIATESRQVTEMDPSQFEQIIMNLAVNARDAMPMGGRLNIRTSFEPGEFQQGRIRLCVSDTGCGMSEATKARLFEPFFTTKEVGKGTGLGLATVYGIIKQVGGDITVESEEGAGARFTLYFPAVTAPPDKPEVEEDVAHSTGAVHPGTILVVEDETSLRNAVSEYLSDLGYKVRVAASGKAALEIARTFADELSLVITDVVMPEMNGWDLVQELKRNAYDFQYLFVSGYADDRILQYGAEAAGLLFLRKPYSFSKLAATVRELMNTYDLQSARNLKTRNGSTPVLAGHSDTRKKTA
ncbi:MAG TPA: PAS domain S-box protein [Candidatus Angelobacter sp.]|nr:PAS domain S-box protein [Candidatus Angelobacter sp.]